MIITNIQIRWSDVDMLAHVYNGVYQQYYDLGKSDYFYQVLGFSDSWATRSDGVVKASLKTDFVEPIQINDKIEVHTAVEKIGNKSITIFQEIIETTSGRLKSQCRTVMVGYNPLTHQSFPIPDHWRAAIEAQDPLKSE